MTLFWLLISTQIDWFSVEQLEDFKHEQNVSGSNGLFPLFSTAACFSPSFPLSLTQMAIVVHSQSWKCVVQRLFWYITRGVCAMPTRDSAKWQLWLNVSNDARDITCVFFSLPLPVRNVQADFSSKHSVWGVNVMCKCVCVCARGKVPAYQLHFTCSLA